ncbi:MAG TPA: GAF domain-containing protein [Gaiellaceae bacterium]|nr:GAF domain-containing protein [Gaiellaceae bacterium]
MSQTVEPSAPALAASRDLFETVLSHLRDGVIVSDAAGRRIYANDQAARLTGYDSAQELLAAPLDEPQARFELFDEAGAPLELNSLPGRRAAAGEEPEPMLVRYRRLPDGRAQTSEVSAVAVHDAGGALQYVISFFREVTAQHDLIDRQKSLYEEAQRTTALLDALYGSAPVGLGFWDRELRYVRVNDALAAINELAPAAHVGKTFAEVVPQVADVIEPVARRVLEQREPVVALEHTSGTPGRPDEVRHWLASYYPVLAHDGLAIGVGCVIEEITDRRRAEQRTELQHTVTGILGESETVEEAVARVLAAIVEILGWDVACFWSIEADDPRVVSVRRGLQLDGFLAMTERLTLTPATLPGRVALSGAPEWLEELDPDRFVRASIALAEGLRSGVAFPVLIESEVVGVLETFSISRRPRDPQLERILSAIGAQLGQFVRRKRAEEERTQLLQRERQARADAEAAAATLRKLGRVSEAALEHLSLSDLLNALLERIVEVLQADTAAILLVADDERLHVRATVGFQQEVVRAIPVPLGAGVAGTVAATRASMLIHDLSEVELISPVLRERGINSLVAIPLVVEDRVIGVVHAGSEAFAQFVDEDARLLELIADRIALAINQASLHEAERAAQERLQLLAEASALLGASLDVESTLERLGSLVAGRFADLCAIHRTDLGEPRLVASARSVPDRVGSLSGAAVGVADVIRTGTGALLRELPAELVDAGVHSCLIVPLQARGRTFGAMTLAWAETDRTYDERDLEFALDIAGRAAIAVDNAELYRAAEERAQAARVLASVGDGVFLVDRHGDVRIWNRAAAVATGLPATEVIGRRAVEAIPGWSAIATRVPIVAAGSGPPRAESLPLDLGGRELWLSLHGVVVPDGVVYAFRDLTEERALETMRTEFVSTVSHELRTPLAAIYGAAMTLRRSDVVLDEGQRAILLDVVSGEADRLARTVNDILWASRLDTDSLHVTIQDCDPVVLAGDVVQAQQAHLDRGHELVLIADDGLPNVCGDPDKVGRILINLVDNGVKYSPDGGRVELRVRAVGSQVRFSVRDQGIGIPPAEQRRIFEKFYRLDPNMTRGVGGTGLGLYICRELVRRMDGRIWVESAGLGRGASFHVELPVAAPF